MLKNKNFMILLIARFISNFGDSLYGVAIVFLLYSFTQSTFYTGLALFLQSSMAIFQFILSPIINRVNMKKYLVLTQFVQALLLISIPIMNNYYSLNVFYILFVVTLSSLINQIVYPSQLSLLPRIIDKEENMLKANSLFVMAYQGSDAIFNAISGIIISAVGLIFAFFIDSISFLVNAGLFMLLTSQIARPLINNNFSIKEEINSYIDDFKIGINIWKNPILFKLLISSIIINFSASFMFASFPKYTNNEFQYSLYLSAMGFGTLLGISIANTSKLKNLKIGNVFSYSILIISIIWLSMGLMPINSNFTRIISIILYLISWIFAGIVTIYSQTMLQVNVDKTKIAVVMSSLYSLTIILSPLGSILGGSITQILGPSKVIIFSGIIIFLVSIFLMTNKNFKNLKNFNDFNLDI